jgi:hypothetical protein
MMVERRAEAVQEGDATEPRAGSTRCVGSSGDTGGRDQSPLDLVEEDAREGGDGSRSVGEKAPEQLSKDWFWGLGTWRAKDGVLRGFESGPRRHGPVKLRRFAFTEADIAYEFRLDGKATFASLPINGARDRGHILNVVLGRTEFRIIAHIRKGESVDLVREKITLDPDRDWHPVRIVLKGETITVTFNGRSRTAKHPVVAEPKDNFGFGGNSGGPEGEKAGAMEFRKLVIQNP